MVIIGGSGHFEYVLEPSVKRSVAAYAPGHPVEDLGRLKKAFPLVNSYKGYEQMLDAEQPDIAVINPHYHLNGAIVLDCLQRGIHCFCEKPISFRLEELEEIEQVYSQGKTHLSTMMVHRYEPWFYAAYRALRQGSIGKPLYISAQKSYKMGVKPEWMQQKALFGGIIPWVGAHVMDLVYWMAQSDLKIMAAAQTQWGNKGQGDVESAAHVQVTWGSAGMGHLQLDYLRPSGAVSHGDDRIRVVGEHGIIEVMNAQVTLISEHHAKQVLATEPGIGLFEDFLTSVTSGRAGRLSAQDAFKVARWCIQAEKLAQKTKGS